MADGEVDPRHAAALHEASQRLVRTVDDLPDDGYAAPSLLPGWSRAHVVAHLALNAEGLTTALRGITEGEPTPVYASSDARDADIGELAGADPATLRARLLGATKELMDAITAVPPDAWGTRLERTPGGRSFPAASVVGMREREVEVHHADLGRDYSRADWSAEFCLRLIDAMTRREAWSQPFTARAVDLGRSWRCGDGTGPTVSGGAADLGWWLAGRGDGDGLTSDDGVLPRIEAW